MVFLDESGFMLQPLVQRTWAPRGHTPIIRCWDRRDRLSVIAAITIPPRRERHRLGAVFRIHPRNIKTQQALAFLRVLERHVGKRGDLANLAPADRHELRGHVRRSLIRQRCRPSLLASAFDHAGLPL